LIKAGYSLVSAFDIIVEHHADESRLLRSAYLDRAKKQGRSDAYIFHHWKHGEIACPHRRLLWYALYLNYRRMKKWREWLKWRMRPEGCPGWEISLIEAIHFYKQYLIEKKRPRNYEKHGLVKIHHL